MANKQGAPGRRSRVESERTRTRILDRAEGLFARKGFRGVSVRELASASGVRPFTLQHHFGSKLGLYQAVLCRWDEELSNRISARLSGDAAFPDLVEEVVDDLFDFFLAKRDWVAVTARATLGEGIGEDIALEDRSWIEFMRRGVRARRLDVAPDLDLRLLLITIEGILNNHILAEAHYRQLFGRDVTDDRVRARTKRHLRDVLLALLGGAASEGARRHVRKKKGPTAS